MEIKLYLFEVLNKYVDRCNRAIMELEKLADGAVSVQEEYRLHGKTEGIKLARDYAREMFTNFFITE